MKLYEKKNSKQNVLKVTFVLELFNTIQTLKICFGKHQHLTGKNPNCFFENVYVEHKL